MAEHQGGRVVDRYGIPQSEFADRTDDNAYVLMLHNHLLDGASDADVMARLKQLGYGTFEAKTILASSKRFIAEELKIDLDERRSEKSGPIELAMRLARQKLLDAKAIRDREMTSPLTYREYLVAGDDKTKDTLKRYVVSKIVPEMWITEANTSITPWTMEDQERLLEILTARDAAIVAAFQSWRDDLNKLAEEGNVAAVRQAEFVSPPAPISE